VTSLVAVASLHQYDLNEPAKQSKGSIFLFTSHDQTPCINQLPSIKVLPEGTNFNG
jgi:hypothetical protein